MENHNDYDNKTRANLAYIWTVIAGLILFYIVYMWGKEKEILTLIIGLIGGTVIGGIFGIYFGGSINKKPDSTQPTTVNNADTVNVDQTNTKI